MPPLPLLPDDPAVDAYLRLEGGDAILAVPPRDFRMQALLVLFLLPVAWAGIALLTALFLPPRFGPAVGGLFLCGATALSTVAGLVMLMRVASRSEATTAVLHADRSLTLADGRRVAPGQIHQVRVGQPNQLLKWVAVMGETDGGPVIILGRLPPSRGAAVAATAEFVGEALGVPVDAAPVARTGLGLSPTSASAFCYMPLQGLWLIFSVICLVMAKDPQVRFAARQSLVYYPLSGIVMVLVSLPFLTVAALTPERHPLFSVAVALAILILGALAILRLGLGAVAMWKAWHGTPWVIPGFGWLTRRWLPEA